MAQNWTWTDYDIVRRDYPKKGLDILHELSDRTSAALTTKAERLGVRHAVPFTDDELAVIDKYGDALGIAVAFLLPDRTVYEIKEQL